MDNILSKLTSGDRRSIGRSDEVVKDVLHQPALFDRLFAGLSSADPLVRMRAADAMEKITRSHPEYLEPYKDALMRHATEAEGQEECWHMAQMLPRLPLAQQERTEVMAILLRYLNSHSHILKTFVMQALADLAEQDPRLRPRVCSLIAELVATGSPAMKARGKALLRHLLEREPEAAI